MAKCKECKGSGVIYHEGSRMLGVIILPSKIKCPKCQGRGKH